MTIPAVSSGFYKEIKMFYYQYRLVPKFSDARKLCCNLPKIQTTGPNLSVFRQKDTDRIAYSGDPDQTAPLGAV